MTEDVFDTDLAFFAFLTNNCWPNDRANESASIYAD